VVEGKIDTNPKKLILDETGKPLPNQAEASAKADSAKPAGASPGASASPAEGTSTRFSKLATGARSAGKIARAGGVFGALFDTALNEITDIRELRNARDAVIKGYQSGEIDRKTATDALKEIDDKIAESRGGSLARGGVAGAGGALGGTVGAIAGGGVASAVTGTAGAIGGSMLADSLLGNAAQSAGGWLSKKLFGASDRGINRELDAIRPGAQPGQVQASGTLNIAGKPVVQGQPLTPDQMSAIGMSLSMNPANAKNYPDWVLAQYNKQKAQGAVSSVAPGAVGAISTNVAGANFAGGQNGNVQTPSGSTGVGSVAASAVGAAVETATNTPESQQTAEQAKVAQAQTDIKTLADQQAQTNQILTAMLTRQEQVAGDARRTVDVLENLNSKS
jgi:hypothetical protein